MSSKSCFISGLLGGFERRICSFQKSVRGGGGGLPRGHRGRGGRGA